MDKTCYTCVFQDSDRGFCCCPLRLAEGEELTFSEVSSLSEESNQTPVCEHWSLGYKLRINDQTEHYSREHEALERFIELVADALVINQPTSIVLVDKGKTIGSYKR